MNPQPSETVGSLWAFIFILGIAFFALKKFIECSGNCKHQNIDLFTIGYMEESIPSVTNTTNNTNIYNSTSTKLSKLQLDCIDTLIAIGYKKTLARKMVLDYFKNNTPSSVQEFIAQITKS